MNEKSNTTDSTFKQLTSDDTNPTGITICYIPDLDNYIECHGCSGKGWIENSKGDLKICPVCDGKGKLNKEKDCTKKDKERDNLPWYPCYPCPGRTDNPYWPTYPIVTNYEIKTDSCTNCYK